MTVAVVDATVAAVGEPPSPIESMTWHEAMDRFGVDKPDLRFAMELVDLGAIFTGTEVRAFAAPCVKAVRVPDGASLGRNRLDGLVERAKELGAKGLAWFKVASLAPVSLTSPLDKVLTDAERAGIVSATGAQTGDLVLVVADEWRTACDVLGQIRIDLGRPPVGEGERRFLWVTEFPLFDGTDEEGNPQAAHHPFTMPHPDDLDLLLTDPARVRSQAYDLVLNGSELGSGSIRIHREDIQRRVFDALGITARRSRGPVRLPAERVPLRRPPARRVRRGRRPVRGRPGGRGQPARGHRLSEDPVRDRPHDRCAQEPVGTGPAGPRLAHHARGRLSPAARRPGGRAHVVSRPPRRGGPGGPDLFAQAATDRLRQRAPLAARLRPRTLDDIVGQRHLVAPDAPLRVLIEAGPAHLRHFVGAGGNGEDDPGAGGGGHHGQDLRAALGRERRCGRRAQRHRRGAAPAR